MAISRALRGIVNWLRLLNASAKQIEYSLVTFLETSHLTTLAHTHTHTHRLLTHHDIVEAPSHLSSVVSDSLFHGLSIFLHGQKSLGHKSHEHLRRYWVVFGCVQLVGLLLL